MDQRARPESTFFAQALLAEGDLLGGRFQIDRRVGAGGMGEVYRALDLELDEVVAVKVMLPGRVSDQAAATALRREVRAARSISSSYVARTFELHNTGGVVFLVMEFIDGASLQSLHKAGRRHPPEQCVVLCRDVLLGLAAAHAAGVIHRDVKPGNIMVRQTGQAILTDFGIARLVQQQNATNGITGTPAYMAPEQLQGTGVGPATDIYALAVVLYELLTNRLPWQGDSAMATAMARLTQPAPPLRQYWQDAPAALDAWLERSLDRDPARRWPSAQAAADALAIAAGQHEQTGFFIDPKQFHLSPGTRSHWAGETTLDSFRLSAGLPKTAGSGSRQATARQTGATGRAVSQQQTQLATDPASQPSHLPRLAVLPFRIPQQLPAAFQAVVGLDDDLIGGLSAYRNLRVLSATSVAREAERHADWQDVAKALGATHVVEGALRSTGEGVRINVRLLRADDEQVLWSQRIDVQRDGLLDVGDTLSKAVADSLDAAQTSPERPKASDNRSATLYLSARANLASDDAARVSVAVALLEQAHRLAASDRVVQGTLAWALARQWSMRATGSQEGLGRARTLLRDLAADGELPAEGALASGVIELALGDAVAAVRALRQAVALSPSLATAHEQLGGLFVAADAPGLGLSRLRTAAMLAPELVGARLVRCQALALEGDWVGHDIRLAKLIADPSTQVQLAQLYVWRARVALWRRDTSLLQGTLEALRAQTGINADEPAFRRLDVLFAAAQGRVQVDELLADGEGQCAAAQQDRLIQAAEVYAFLGQHERAWLFASAAAGMGALLLAWLRHCPLLEPVRHTGRWQALAELAERRTAALVSAWHGDTTH